MAPCEPWRTLKPLAHAGGFFNWPDIENGLFPRQHNDRKPLFRHPSVLGSPGVSRIRIMEVYRILIGLAQHSACSTSS